MGRQEKTEFNAYMWVIVRDRKYSTVENKVVEVAGKSRRNL